MRDSTLSCQVYDSIEIGAAIFATNNIIKENIFFVGNFRFCIRLNLQLELYDRVVNSYVHKSKMLENDVEVEVVVVV